jgi:hypothetical protein
MKVYIVYEFSDYGLLDMSNGKIFATLEAAKVYSDEYLERVGYGLDISEWDVE